MDVLVLGAGVIGLTTAVVLAESGHEVRVYTKEAPDQTTSAAAGAIWGIYSVGEDVRLERWAARTLRELNDLSNKMSSIRSTSGRLVSRHPAMARPPEADLLDDLRSCTELELPPGYKSGFHYTTPVVAMPSYLAHLVARLEKVGGRLETKEVDSLSGVLACADTVVNCTGFAASEDKFGADPKLWPARGQVVVADNPGIDEFLMDDENGTEPTYIIPHADKVVLGGTLQEYNQDRAGDPDVTKRILARCAEVEPKLRGIGPDDVEVRVGIRPNRSSVRLERELGTPRLIHNYGHGGAGVSLSWGCAYTVLDLLANRADAEVTSRPAR